MLNTAFILSLIAGVVIPHVSALVSDNTKIPAEYAGYVSMLLAAATGFFSEWAQQPDNYNWKRGVLNAGVAFVLAVTTHKGALKDTGAEDNLLDFGKAKSRRDRRAERAADRAA